MCIDDIFQKMYNFYRLDSILSEKGWWLLTTCIYCFFFLEVAGTDKSAI